MFDKGGIYVYIYIYVETSSNRSICNTNIVLVELLFISFICLYPLISILFACDFSPHVIPSSPAIPNRCFGHGSVQLDGMLSFHPPWHWRTKGGRNPKWYTTKKSNIDQKWPYLSKKCHLFTFSLNIILGIHVRFRGYKGSFPNYPAKKKTHPHSEIPHALLHKWVSNCNPKQYKKNTGRVHCENELKCSLPNVLL